MHVEEESRARAAADTAELLRLLELFRRRLEDPLLSLPDPRLVRRRLFVVSKPSTRRSRRIAGKGVVATSAIKRAQALLMKKLGICRDEARLSSSQLEEYAAIFSSPLGAGHVRALAALFGLSSGLVDGDEMPQVDALVA